MTTPIKIVNAKEMSEKPNQEKIWDIISAPWKEFREKSLEVVEDFLKGKRGKIIDLGCGTGRNMISNKDIEYWGVDFSKGQLSHIDKEKVNAKLFKSDITKLPKEFKDEMFDYGLFIATLHCLETKEARKKSLREFYRVLKDKGEALITVWNSEDPRFKGMDKELYIPWHREHVPYLRYYYLYDKQELIDLLEEVGFKILEINKAKEKDSRFSKKNFIVRVRK